MKIKMQIKTILFLLFFVINYKHYNNAMQAPQQPSSLRYQTAQTLAKGIVEGKRPLTDLQKLPFEVQNFAQLLIDNNLDINAAFKKALTNLTIYSSDDIENLLQAGANPNIQDNLGNTPLHNAIIDNIPWLFNLLLDYKASISIPNNKGQRPLIYAALEGNSNFVNRLLKAGADINQPDDLDNTPLMVASEMDNLDIVALLLDNGADVNRKNWIGENALLIALSKNGNNVENIVSLLLDAGANINDTSSENLTPLMIATIKGRITIVKKLLNLGADKTKVTNEGKTALDIAKNFKRTEIIQLLQMPELVPWKEQLRYYKLEK